MSSTPALRSFVILRLAAITEGDTGLEDGIAIGLDVLDAEPRSISSP